MSDLMVSALRLTLLGMGMTFLSIGALVGGMFLLTRLTMRRQTDQPQQMVTYGAETGGDERPSGLPESRGSNLEGRWDDDEERRRSVAAAVAVSMALNAESDRSPGMMREETLWNGYVRGLHLSARSRYESLRGRR